MEQTSTINNGSSSIPPGSSQQTGLPTTSQDHIEAIFNGLPSEYNVFITSVNTRTNAYSVAKIEALLMAQEVQLDKAVKELDIAKAEANLALTENQTGRGHPPNLVTLSLHPKVLGHHQEVNLAISEEDHVTLKTLLVGKLDKFRYQFDSNQLNFLNTHKQSSLPQSTNIKSTLDSTQCLPIKQIQSDWKAEYQSFTHFLQQSGIEHKVSYPHTHEQNGVMERKHMHIVESGLTLIAQASTPLKFWDEAYMSSVFLIYRMPPPLLNNFYPLKVLFNVKPDYSSLKVFDCLCYSNLRPYNKVKLQYRSQPCTFMRYSLAHKGYKCLSNYGRVYISKDVLFDELVFSLSITIHTKSYFQFKLTIAYICYSQKDIPILFSLPSFNQSMQPVPQAPNQPLTNVLNTSNTVVQTQTNVNNADAHIEVVATGGSSNQEPVASLHTQPQLSATNFDIEYGALAPGQVLVVVPAPESIVALCDLTINQPTQTKW
uniref:Integrase catalytic domain-containing protein n=1 Tax=Cannabis sativa TaxID=3483 RepID=A0A803PEU8_CANSA